MLQLQPPAVRRDPRLGGLRAGRRHRGRVLHAADPQEAAERDGQQPEELHQPQRRRLLLAPQLLRDGDELAAAAPGQGAEGQGQGVSHQRRQVCPGDGRRRVWQGVQGRARGHRGRRHHGGGCQDPEARRQPADEAGLSQGVGADGRPAAPQHCLPPWGRPQG